MILIIFMIMMMFMIMFMIMMMFIIMFMMMFMVMMMLMTMMMLMIMMMFLMMMYMVVMMFLMMRMGRELAGGESQVAPQIDNLLIIDRMVDPLTPLLTQLTYEGLIDEIYGVNNSTHNRHSALFEFHKED